MSLKKIDPKVFVLFIIVLAVAAMRIPNSAGMTVLSNFTPIGAMGLFGGAYFKNNWKAYLFPLTTLFISDLVINIWMLDGRFGVMYGGWYFTYGAFALIVLLGTLIIRRVSIVRIVLAAVSSSLLYWMIADFGVWMSGHGLDLRTMTPLTNDWNGLMQSYIQGIPYIPNFLVGTLLYSFIMFGLFEWLKKRYPSLQGKPAIKAVA